MCVDKGLYIINMQPLKSYEGTILFKTSTPDYRLPNLILLILITGDMIYLLKGKPRALRTIHGIKDDIPISIKKVK